MSTTWLRPFVAAIAILTVGPAQAGESNLMVPVQLTQMPEQVTTGAIRCRMLAGQFISTSWQQSGFVPLKEVGSGETTFPIDPKTGVYASTVNVKVSWQPLQPNDVPKTVLKGPVQYRYACLLRLRHASGVWADLDGKTTPPAWATPVGDSTTVVSNY